MGSWAMYVVAMVTARAVMARAVADAKVSAVMAKAVADAKVSVVMARAVAVPTKEARAATLPTSVCRMPVLRPGRRSQKRA